MKIVETIMACLLRQFEAVTPSISKTQSGASLNLSPVGLRLTQHLVQRAKMQKSRDIPRRFAQQTTATLSIGHCKLETVLKCTFS